MRVVVEHRGLDQIDVHGDLEPEAVERLKRSLRVMAQALADELTKERAPVSHYGF